MSTITDASLLFDQYLSHLSDYRVLVCRSCQYAIQPSAISGHLKGHKVFREERKALLEIANSLKLSEPDVVVYPLHVMPSIASLPVTDGYLCNHFSCDHACGSLKRMQRHWAVEHGRPCEPDKDYRSALLQTFFRGSKVRYFEVAANDREPVVPRDDTRPSDSPPSITTQSSDAEAPRNDLRWADDLRLLHHYTVATSQTLLRGSEAAGFWAETVPRLAHSNEYLMHGILSISAAHLAHLHPSDSNAYMTVCATHQDLGFPGFRRALERLQDADSVAVAAFARLLIISECAMLRACSRRSNTILGTSDDCTAFLRLMQGGCSLVTENLLHMPAVAARAIRIREIEDKVASQKPFHGMQYFENLYHKIETLCTGAEKYVIEIAIRVLSRSFAVSAAASDKDELWMAVESWAFDVGPVYANMLAQRHPAALIVFAHFCILVHRLADLHWFMRGHAHRLLISVRSGLEEGQKGFTSWPMEALGDHST